MRKKASFTKENQRLRSPDHKAFQCYGIYFNHHGSHGIYFNLNPFNTSVEHTPHPQPSVYEWNPSIFVLWGTWGMFQWSVGIFFESTRIFLTFKKTIRPSKQTCNGTPRSNLHPKGSSIWLSTAPNSRLRGEKAFGDLSHCYPLGERENISHLEKKKGGETHLQNWHFRGYVIVPRKVCISLQKLIRSGGKHEETWDVDHDSWRTPKRSLLTPEKDT